MPKRKVLSGKEVVAIIESFGFSIVSQRGSHIKIRRKVDGNKQTLTIPNHSELDKGTISAIYRQAVKYIPDAELREHFYA
jgi:predicted RNA binding protein YcfA (HicA-like mRNA interferase family)